MADAESLKSFMIDIGFQVDAGQQRRLQEALTNVEKNVTRFSQATHRSTGFLGQFFQFFQKSEGPMRQHTETTDKLAKSFDEFGKSLKGVVAVVAGGALTKALLDLNDQFTKLHYTARDAGTTVANLMAEQFGGARVGLSAERVTGILTNFRQALLSIPNAAQILAKSFDVDIARFVDPVTGKIKDTAAVFDALLPKIGEIYRQGPIAVNYVNSILESVAHIQIPPDLASILLDPDLIRKRIEGEAAAKGWAARLGVDLNQAATNAVDVTNRFNDIWYILTVIKGGIEETFGPPAARALESFRDGLLHLVDVAKQASAGMIEAFKSGGFEGLGQYITQQLDTIDWTNEGATAAQKFVDGMVAFIKAQGPANLADAWRKALSDMIVGAVNQMLNDLREQMQKIPGLRWFPGVGQPSGAGEPSHYQHGGIVPRTGPAYLHAGEGVVTADAMSGLARLGPIMEDLWDGFRGWWFGSGAYHPTVVIANTDDLAEAFREQDIFGKEGAGGYPGNAGGAGPRGSRAIGAPREPVTAPPVFANIAEQRRPLAEEVASDPATKKMLMQMMATEGGGVATVEALFNRVAMIKQKIQGYKIKEELLSGFYGPFNRGEAQRTEISARQAEQYQRIIDQVVSGSNLIQGRVNQGSPSDRGANLPGRIRIPGSSEIYNFFEGARRKIPFSVEDSMRFAEQEARLANALSAAPLGTTNSYRAGDKTVTLNAQSNFNISGTDALSVGGAINSVLGRTNADLIRNLSPIVQ